MAILLSLGAVAATLSSPKMSRSEERTRAGEPPATSDAPVPDATPDRRRYFDSRGRSRSKAIGRVGRGFLRNAVPLDPSETIFLKPSAVDHRYGTYELVEAIRESAMRVDAEFSGSRLTVGDLSKRGGGRIRPHRSHRRGLDADIGFYLREEGGPSWSPTFVRMDASGADRQGSGMRFDVARNWTLVAALLTQRHAQVQYIFVAAPLAHRLIAHGEARGAPPEVLEAARHVVMQPRRGARHDNHFHLRIYCPVDDRPSCVDAPPFHPWLEDPPPAPRPRRARPRPNR